eukprot:COSAG01_NODE_10356_length_2185_cov_33.834939_3_plen_60_part_00
MTDLHLHTFEMALIQEDSFSQAGAMFQTDLVPTLALALGIPIPFPSIGGALAELVLPPE